MVGWTSSEMSPASELTTRRTYMDRFTLQEDLDRFVHRQNLMRFQKLIDESAGEAPDKQLLKLQAEEAAKDHLPSKEK
jgi:hypothetical protein